MASHRKSARKRLLVLLGYGCVNLGAFLFLSAGVAAVTQTLHHLRLDLLQNLVSLMSLLWGFGF